MNEITLVTGAANGLGFHIVESCNLYESTIGCDIAYADYRYVDVRSIASIQTLLYNLSVKQFRVTGLINNAAVNHIDWLPDLHEDDYDRVMAVNAKGIFLMTQALVKSSDHDLQWVCNIVSNAAHTPMRCSLAYNASKGAAHIMTLQMARELGDQGISVFGIAPNKLAGTEMSRYIDESVPRTRGWTPEEATEYQRKALVSGTETDPAACAEFIAHLCLSDVGHKRYIAGCIFPYGI